MLGESRDFGPSGKELWWCNESVHSKVKVKKNILKSDMGVKMSKVEKV